MKQRVTFQYRDADNYKFPFTAVVETATPIAVNEEAELPYESLGFTQERFHREIVKYPYDDTSDHNLLEVHEVENVADDTETDYQYAPAATPKEEKFP